MTLDKAIERMKNNPTVLIVGLSAISIFIIATVLRNYYLYIPGYVLVALELFAAKKTED